MIKTDYKQIRANEEINLLIEKGNDTLKELGYTEHSKKHAAKTAETAGRILKELGYGKHKIELAKIAGYMHDIGNSINRQDHAHSGAILAYQILKDTDLPLKDILVITTAVGHHDEATGTAVDGVSAALILADKTDVRRNRVQNRNKATFDIHDRVNYAALSSRLIIDKEKRMIQMELELDDSICTVMDYFEIFLKRMLMCRRAAERLNCKFKLVANGTMLTAKEKSMENIYMNRELSWLKFNERVLEEAENNEVPLCERMNFVSIYQSNLDEFFRVRVGSLQDQMLVNKKIRDNKTNMTSEEQIKAILKEVKRLNKRKDAAYADLMKKVAEYGITLVDFKTAKPEEKKFLEQYFNHEIVPLSSPTIVGKRQPFPFLRNQEIYAVVVLETRSGKERIGIIPCTNNMVERLVEIPGGEGRYVLSENIVLHYIGKVFKGYKVIGKSLIRVVRNADIDADALYDEDLDYREFMADLMKQRRKLTPVRLDMSREIDVSVVESLCRYLKVEPERVFRSDAPLDLSFVYKLQDLLRMHPELFYGKRVPQKSASFRDGESILRQIEEGDKLLSYPYESIRPFLNMLYEAAEDENVLSIKMTLYRLAKQSKIVEALCEAAENGKEVVVLVELRARFDEENNIRWSRMLEKAGCQIIYGLEGFKVHSKLCLITKKGRDGVEYITQIGTGNYNEKTARLYTDLSLMTTNVEIGLDAAAVFQALTKGETVEESGHLLVAPKCLQNRILDMIQEEIDHKKNGEEAYIGLKLNSLTDKKIMDKLVEASCAGVHIDMIIRGISCLIPGVEGKTENIRIISIVGRFLEHSRIYIFGCGERRKYYISSADFMTRNTVKRVEVAAPVYDPAIRARIQGIFDLMLSDNQKARDESAEGVYALVPHEGEPVNSQEILYQEAYDRAALR